MNPWNMRRIELAIVVLLVSCLLAMDVGPKRHHFMWIDTVAGSIKREVRFLKPTIEIQRSSLEKWIIDHEGAYENQWRLQNSTTYTFYGRRVSSVGCIRRQAIYRLQAGDKNDAFVRAASDAEIAELVQVMRTGTDEEQEKAVDAALVIALK